MMLAGSRRKGVTVLRKVAGRSATADHQSLLLSPFENLLVPEWTRISSSSSSSSSSLSSQQRYIVSSSSQSSSVTIISDERDPSVSQNPAYWQQQTRVFHESPPSRQLKLKVPVKKGIKIRAKSSSSAFPSALDFATTSASTINNRNNPNPTTIMPKRISSRRQRLEAVRALPAASELDLDWENDDYDTTTNQEEDSNAVVAASRISTVEACYVAKHIDLAQCVMNEFSKVSALSKGATARKFRAESLLLEFPPPTSPSSASADAITSNSNNADDETAAAASETPPMPSYVAVYRFGSVIFFNVSPRQRDQVIKIVKKYATEALVAGFEQRDSYGVCVRPDAPKTRVTPEYCIVQKLDMNAVAVISEVMAQSVALDAYNDIVDSLLDNFAILNSKISTTSTVDLDKQVLFSKIAQNNRIFIDLISKLRIKARSQIAWDKGEYEVIHAGMTGEFEIDDRFELIQFKLDLIQQNSKLFLEVIHHQKSASVEWVIVWLISFECVLMCLDMSGQGSVMFEFAKNIIG